MHVHTMYMCIVWDGSEEDLHRSLENMDAESYMYIYPQIWSIVAVMNRIKQSVHVMLFTR